MSSLVLPSPAAGRLVLLLADTCGVFPCWLTRASTAVGDTREAPAFGTFLLSKCPCLP